MKIRLVFLSAALPMFLLAGCATGPHVIETDSRERVITLQIDDNDWQTLASRLAQSLVASGKITSLRQPAIVAIDRIKNNTSQHNLNTSQLELRFKAAVAGQPIQFSNAEGVGAQSPYAKQAGRDAENIAAFEKGESQINTRQQFATYTLGGEVIEQQARDGNDRQVTFTVHLWLTDTQSRTTVWQDRQALAKKSSRGIIAP